MSSQGTAAVFHHDPCLVQSKSKMTRPTLQVQSLLSVPKLEVWRTNYRVTWLILQALLLGWVNLI